MSQYFEADLDYEAARELKQLLDSLFDNPGWRVLIEWIDQRVTVRERALIDMCPRTMEEMVDYAKIHGGLQELRLLPAALAQTHMDLQTALRRMQEEAEEELEDLENRNA